MRLLYPYNEILPCKRAHDVYLFNECVALAEKGEEVFLLCGRGTVSDAALYSHYENVPQPQLMIRRLPIVRKNNALNISWNRPFFFFTEREIRRLAPDIVLLSVLKQARYHLERKRLGTKYIYEVHQLTSYPGAHSPLCAQEKEVLARADAITVTTRALMDILKNPPYSLGTKVVHIPLAVKASLLPPPPISSPVKICYVGQLYKEQGLLLLLEAFSKTTALHLQIVGGTLDEISLLKKRAQLLNIAHRCTFLGFQPPSRLQEILCDTHAFVAPFTLEGRMPYVAHTKVLEYAEWGRPLVIPDILASDFPGSKGVLFFKTGDANSLAASLVKLKDAKVQAQLQADILAYSGAFSWRKRAELYQCLFAQI